MKDTALATLMVMMGAEEIKADQTTGAVAPQPSGPPVTCGIIGCGEQGRKILSILSRLPAAEVAAVCDIYAPFVKRGQEIAPKAAGISDYRQLLDQKEVEVVFIETPTFAHKDITLAAIQAGKHIYCDAPLAGSMEDAKAIALAGQSSKQIFQTGLQNRSNPQHLHVVKFIRTGVLGTIAETRAQWHNRDSWRRAAPTTEREKELNWRLYQATSTGLLGEVGIHQVDVASWFLNSLPISARAYGGIMGWKDDRNVFDTVQCMIEYPNNTHLIYDATLVSSYDAVYDLFLGSASTVMMRGERAWMFKEADAPMLGWEVYAKKDRFGDETGIELVADATKLLAQGKEPSSESQAATGKGPLYYAVEAFLNSVHANSKPLAGAIEGYQATVAAIKANDAATSGAKIVYQPEWFQLS
ncbi:MAG: Gfo/Idh/MocA family oxidoreductase [Armatimonadetes bacterium]|nr:Gfo/Idh/MocA family oxidoreductase [Armatimonadota bacterium]